jgi:hypothetical protein
VGEGRSVQRESGQVETARDRRQERIRGRTRRLDSGGWGVGALRAAWDRAHAALDLFDADGRLNDRGRAEVEITEALKGLTAPEWSKVHNFLNDARSLSFLDRMHRRLEEAEPRPECVRPVKCIYKAA